MPRVITVIDDFLPDPDAVRALALSQEFGPSDYHKGLRSAARFHHMVDPQVMEDALGLQVDDWDRHGMNGRFQICTPLDPIVYHADLQTHAATLYLTPNAPVEAGLSLYRSKITGARRAPLNPTLASATFDNNLLDPSKWELVDKIGNVYNRLVIWDGALIHAASSYFGHHPTNARLFWMFFFDMKRFAAPEPEPEPTAAPALVKAKRKKA